MLLPAKLGSTYGAKALGTRFYKAVAPIGQKIYQFKPDCSDTGLAAKALVQYKRKAGLAGDISSNNAFQLVYYVSKGKKCSRSRW